MGLSTQRERTMRLIDRKRNDVPEELKAIAKAVWDTGCVTVTDGQESIMLMEDHSTGECRYVVSAARMGEAVFESIEEAYMRFRFLVEADFQVCLPFL